MKNVQVASKYNYAEIHYYVILYCERPMSEIEELRKQIEIVSRELEELKKEIREKKRGER
ncbi:MAG: hypothetical protein DRJ47_07195 [Thermoprotei archaeon]|nr:MAG: hypothetical protein DRJ47_07195 [Thermoprotei archaeon]